MNERVGSRNLDELEAAKARRWGRGESSKVYLILPVCNVSLRDLAWIV